MSTIYLLTFTRYFDDLMDGFATNDEELRWLVKSFSLSYYGLEVDVDIDWEAETVTATPDDDIEPCTYHIHKVHRATEEYTA